MATAYRTLAERPLYDEPVKEPQVVAVDALGKDVDDDINVAIVRLVAANDEEPTSAITVALICACIMVSAVALVLSFSAR